MESLQEKQLYKYIGNRVRTLREELGLTQLTLSQRLQMSRATIANLELGRQRPPLHILLKISQLFGREMSDLLPTHAELKQEVTKPQVPPNLKVFGKISPKAKSAISGYTQEREDND